MKESLSMYIDSELVTDKAENFFVDFRDDTDFRDDWFYYHFLGDIMRGQPAPDDGFSLRIIEKLNNIEIDPLFDPLSSED
jgi:negative regulator of sigma E activity